MTKVKQFERVLELLRAEAPGTVTKETLEAKLGGEVAVNRVSTYIWEIRKKTGVPVESVKDGRKVVGFRIPATAVTGQTETAPTE